jgi:hypothetical protein
VAVGRNVNCHADFRAFFIINCELKLQSKWMECKEKQRLIEEYFDTFKRQQWIMQRLESIRADGDLRSIHATEKQSNVATEECYDAWRAMNEHECSEQCD